jgi:fatty acid desaturase
MQAEHRSPVDWRALRDAVRDDLGEDMDPRAFADVLERRMRVFSVLQVGELLFLMLAPWWGLKVVVAVTFALYRSRTVWTIIHNRVHQPRLPNTPAKRFYDFATGYVALWWRDHHLRHHAQTNTARDPDTRMFFGRDMNDVRNPPSGWGGRGLRLLTTIAQFPFFFPLFFFRSLSNYRGGSPWIFVLALAAWGSLMSLILPRPEAILNTLSNFGVGTAYILLTFAPTHTASPDNFALTDDNQANQVLATNNVWPTSAWYSWLCGGINLHIEHHLFPQVPSDALPRVVPHVRSWAKARGLPYHAYSLWGIWRAHLAFLARF